MEQIRFSIITPVHIWTEERKQGLLRCIESIQNQTFDHDKFEHIIVDDGSAMEYELPNYSWLKLVKKQHEERIIAYNKGLEEAKGEIFCLLDSDDEYETDYLEKVDKMFTDNPSYKIFNFGCTNVNKEGKEWKRGPFTPDRLDIGHIIFGGGTIVNGTFVFHRSLFDDYGAYPHSKLINVDCSEINYPAFKGQERPYIRDLSMATPFDFSAAAQLEFPEIRQYYMIDHVAEPNKILKELGNPWGNDYYLFYKYTRKNHSFPVEEYLYRVHLK